MIGKAAARDVDAEGQHSVGPVALPGSPAGRLTALKELLDRAAVARTGVRAAGQEGEIAVVEACSTELAVLAGLVRDIRALGFRYITLDLAASASGLTVVAAGEPAPDAAVTNDPR